MHKLRIGVNALYLVPGGVGGTEIYLRSLLAALATVDASDEYFVFMNRETDAELVPDRPNFTAVRQGVYAASRPARILWEQIVLPVALERHGIDVLLNPGFTSPVFCSSPSVTVFHDLQHKRHPEYFRWFDLPFWRVFLFASAHLSTLLLADSEATAEDLLRYYRLPGKKIKVAALGVDPCFFAIPRRQAADPYLLAVSTLHPHKNIDGLLRAFAEFRRTRPEFRLVVAGLRGFYTGPLERLCVSLALQDAVEFTGWIPRQALLDLYAGAAAFVYPSTFEGFGLPVLEALAAGIPTACSNIQPLAGIAAGAALTFDPHDSGEICRVMLRLVGDATLRGKLTYEGPRRAREFPWEATARSTLAALKQAGGSRS